VVEVVIAAQPSALDVVYVTVYVPGALVLGVIAPVEELRDKPVDEEYVPPENAPVPVKVTA
jgi:hypothetical protein